MTDEERVAQGEYHRQQVTEQQAAEQLTLSGGKAAKKGYPLGEAWAVNLAGVNITDNTFDSLKALGSVAELDLSKTNITDAEMARVAEVGGYCFKLDLSHTAVTDAGLAPLAELGLLMNLNLTGTKVSAGAAADFKTKRAANPKLIDLVKNMQIKR